MLRNGGAETLVKVSNFYISIFWPKMKTPSSVSEDSFFQDWEDSLVLTE